MRMKSNKNQLRMNEQPPCHSLSRHSVHIYIHVTLSVSLCPCLSLLCDPFFNVSSVSAAGHLRVGEAAEVKHEDGVASASMLLLSRLGFGFGNSGFLAPPAVNKCLSSRAVWKTNPRHLHKDGTSRNSSQWLGLKLPVIVAFDCIYIY